jgi:hypothetical protein
VRWTEIGKRSLDDCLTDAFGIATDDCDGVFLSADIDACDPGHASEPGRLSREVCHRASCSTPRRMCMAAGPSGSTSSRCRPYDHAAITAALANRVVLEALIERPRLAAAAATAGPVSTSARDKDLDGSLRTGGVPEPPISDSTATCKYAPDRVCPGVK